MRERERERERDSEEDECGEDSGRYRVEREEDERWRE